MKFASLHLLLGVAVLKEGRRGRSNRHELALTIWIAEYHVVASVDQAPYTTFRIAAQEDTIAKGVSVCEGTSPAIQWISVTAAVEDALVRRRRSDILAVGGGAQELPMSTVQSPPATEPPGWSHRLAVGRSSDSVARPLIRLLATIDVPEH